MALAGLAAHTSLRGARRSTALSIPDSQLETAAFLQSLTGAAPVETHISAVFTGGAPVLKLKKAVTLPYLDFSTAARRRHFLLRELTLNKPGAGDIYMDVMAVVRAGDGGLRLAPLDDAAPAIDYVLRMAAVDKDDFLAAVAAQAGVTDTLADALGDTIAADHARRPTVSNWGSEAALRGVIEGNVCAATQAGLDGAKLLAWRAAARLALKQLATFLEGRARAGLVRRCHGDLHLGNICLWHGRPLPFDALEFDEDLGTIDTGYDLGFLLMDLDFRVGRGAANRVFNRYVARTGDAAMAPPMALFMSIRASVRVVTEMASGRGESAAAYLDRALSLLQPAAGLILAIGGLPGTGKSTLARRVAPALGGAPGALILRSDEIRKRLFGVAPEQVLPDDAYTEVVSTRVMATLVHDACAGAAGGHAVIADATFMNAADREDLENAARARDIPFAGVWLHADAAELERRIDARRNDASDADLAVLRNALKKNVGFVGWTFIDATNQAEAVRNVDAILDGSKLKQGG
jgi:hypothetical protein